MSAAESSSALSPELADCPFPGPASFDYEGRGRFSGREDETVALTSILLGRQLTVLTAGSGDGKTSLIHAGVLPLLFHEGIEAAVAEPGGQAPLAAIGEACLDRLLPTRAIYRDLTARLEAVGEAKTLRDAREHCGRLSRSERQQLLVNKPARRPVNLLEGGALASWLRDQRLSDSYLANAMNALTVLEGRSWPGADAPLCDIQAFFAGGDAVAAPDLRGEPEEAAEGLLAAMGAAISLRRSVARDFELVLVVDQFEELFVQFRGGPGAQGPASQRWRHREAFLSFLRNVRAKGWPLRLVLSLRKEHYADLQVALREPDGLASCTYHLGPLMLNQAKSCLLRQDIWPAGKAPTEEQAQAVVDGLKIEERYVHPTLLSVVGEWLWRQSDIARLTPDDLRSASSGAIDAFVERAFEAPYEGATWDPPETREALEILTDLIISEGGQSRRNSVAEATLLNAPLRDRALRERLLGDLQRRRLVRIEPRLGGFYVEIVHERLIEAIQRYLEKLRREDESFTALRRLLEDLQTDARRPVCSLLDEAQRNVLVANVERLSLPSVIAARTVARLLLDPNLGEALNREATGKRQAVSGGLRATLRRLAENAERQDSGELSASPQKRMEDGWFASPAEAEAYLQASSEIAGGDTLNLMLGSALLHRDDLAAERIRALGRRLRYGRAA